MPFLDLLLIGLFDSVPQRLLSVVVVSFRASQLYKFGYDCAAAQSSKTNIVRRFCHAQRRYIVFAS